MVLNSHSLKHKPDDISWSINHRYNFSLTLAIKQDIWYAFSEVSTLSIKIHIFAADRQMVFAGTHLKVRDSGWLGGMGNGTLEREVEKCANDYSRISNSVSFFPLLLLVQDYGFQIRHKF